MIRSGEADFRLSENAIAYLEPLDMNFKNTLLLNFECPGSAETKFDPPKKLENIR